MTTTSQQVEMGGLRIGQRSDVDWVTATTIDDRCANYWLELWHKQTSGATEPKRRFQFSGFVGLQCDGLIWSVRQRDSRTMMIASGEKAATLWRKIYTPESKITRIDLAVDVWLDQCIPLIPARLGRVYTSEVWDANEIKYSCVSSTGKRAGSTLYVGSRQSERMGRFYDKGGQTALCEPGRWYRYELEFKGLSARKATSLLHCTEDTDIPNYVLATVSEFFSTRYVPVMFTPSREGMHIRTFVRKTTPEKKLAWLSSQVRPTIEYLFDIGLGEQVLDVLLSNCLPSHELEKLRQQTKEVLARQRVDLGVEGK